MKNILSLLFAFVLLSSCSKDVDPEHPFTGEWKGEELSNNGDESHFYHFYFCDNTFKLASSAGYDYPSPPCGPTEYIAGQYSVQVDKLILTGYYTDSLYTITSSGCPNSGAFEKVYTVKSIFGGFQLIPEQPRYPSYGYGHDRFNISKVDDNGCNNGK